MLNFHFEILVWGSHSSCHFQDNPGFSIKKEKKLIKNKVFFQIKVKRDAEN